MSRACRFCALCALFAVVVIPARAQTSRFISFAAFDAPTTQPWGMNDRGDVVGMFTYNRPADPHPFNSFAFLNGLFHVVEVPGSSGQLGTWAQGINNRQDIVGYYEDAGREIHGFLLSRGLYSSFDVPNHYNETQAYDINDRGDIVGRYLYTFPDPTRGPGFLGVEHAGFLLRNGSSTSIKFPASTYTDATGINNRGDIVGNYSTAQRSRNGYALINGEFLSISPPGALETHVVGINDAGNVVGYYYSRQPGYHYFVLSRGEYVNITVPETDTGLLSGINNRGAIVGQYTPMGSRRSLGFVFNPRP